MLFTTSNFSDDGLAGWWAARSGGALVTLARGEAQDADVVGVGGVVGGVVVGGGG